MTGAEPRGSRVAGAVLLLAALALVALPALAEDPKRVGVRITVSHAGSEPGAIGPKSKDLHERLRSDFRYESLRVIQSRDFDLRIDEVGSLELPTGRWVRVRPLDMDARGVLIAVDIEQTLKTDLRVRNRQQVVIGAQRYQGGKLIITLEPRY